MVRVHVSHDEQTNRMRIELDDASLALASALRRALMAEVPSVAIDRVAIFSNDSVVPDCEIAHRLGMMPIYDPTPSAMALGDGAEAFASFFDRQDIRVPPAGIRAKLEVRAGAHERRTVRARDLAFEPARVVPVEPDSVVTVLEPGERVSLDASVAWGMGKWHAKWNCVVAPVCRRAVPLASPECGVCGRSECGASPTPKSRDEGAKRRRGGSESASLFSATGDAAEHERGTPESEVLQHVLEFSTTGAHSPPQAMLLALSSLRGKLRAFVRALESCDRKPAHATVSDDRRPSPCASQVR